MKTAMQELIERLDKTEKQLEKENNLVMSSALFAAKNMALEALEKEKEQIIDAHTNAYLIGEDDISVEDANEASIKYYNQTYNQKIPELLYKDGNPMRKVKLCKQAQELLDESTKRFNKNK